MALYFDLIGGPREGPMQAAEKWIPLRVGRKNSVFLVVPMRLFAV
jgi:hypothetical protein